MKSVPTKFWVLTWIMIYIVNIVSPMSHWGREFLITYVPNIDQSGENAIYISALQAPAKVYLQNALFKLSSLHSVNAYSSIRITLPASLHYTDDGVVKKKAVYLNSTADVSVYVLNFRNTTAGTYTAYPLQAMGQEYILGLYPPLDTNTAYFVIAAVFDDTRVQVKFRFPTASKCMTQTYRTDDVANVTLNSRDVWGGGCSQDLTGSVVTSDKPVTVITGLKCDIVPRNLGYCDHMVEMMLPVEDYGYTYLLHSLDPRRRGAIYRVVSGYDNALVTDSAGGKVTLNKGQFKDYDVTSESSELCITSTMPVMTLLFTKSADFNLQLFGDASMSVVPPTERFTSDYVINLEMTKTIGTFLRYATVAIHGLDIGWVFPETTNFRSIGCGYFIKHVTLDNTTTWLRHTRGSLFGVTLLALADRIGMSMPGGFQLFNKSQCQSAPCLNNASCMHIPVTEDFFCNCTSGFSGKLCEIASTTAPNTPSGTQPTTEQHSTASTADISSTPNLTSSDLTSTDFVTTDLVTTDLVTTDLVTTDLVTTDLQQNSTTAQIPLCIMTTGDESVSTVMTTGSELLSTIVTTEGQVVNLQPTTSASESCSCSSAEPPITNLTQMEMWMRAIKIAQQLKIDLKVDKEHLSSTVRKLTSAMDYRPSARGMGYLGILCIVSLFGILVIPDVTRLWQVVQECKRKRPLSHSV